MVKLTLTFKSGLATQKQSDFALILLSGRAVHRSRFTARSSRLASRFVLVVVLESGHAE
jgi:hypothetical protein